VQVLKMLAAITTENVGTPPLSASQRRRQLNQTLNHRSGSVESRSKEALNIPIPSG
jgi:hypothetical protein